MKGIGGERPEFLIWQFPFSDIAGKEFDSRIHPRPLKKKVGQQGLGRVTPEP